MNAFSSIVEEIFRQSAYAFDYVDDSRPVKKMILGSIGLELFQQRQECEDRDLGLFLQFMAYAFPRANKSRSQLAQDLWVLFMLDELRDGVFLEIGAGDGLKHSNTYLLETEFGWTGVLAEPNTNMHRLIRERRKAALSVDAIAEQAGRAIEFEIMEDPYLSRAKDAGAPPDLHDRLGNRKLVEQTTVTTQTFAGLCAQFQLQHIDFVSLDTEGSELDILKTIDFESRRIPLFCVEHNWSDNARPIYDLMTAHGYRAWLPEFMRNDYFFVHDDYLHEALQRGVKPGQKKRSRPRAEISKEEVSLLDLERALFDAQNALKDRQDETASLRARLSASEIELSGVRQALNGSAGLAVSVNGATGSTTPTARELIEGERRLREELRGQLTRLSQELAVARAAQQERSAEAIRASELLEVRTAKYRDVVKALGDLEAEVAVLRNRETDAARAFGDAFAEQKQEIARLTAQQESQLASLDELTRQKESEMAAALHELSLQKEDEIAALQTALHEEQERTQRQGALEQELEKLSHDFTLVRNALDENILENQRLTGVAAERAGVIDHVTSVLQEKETLIAEKDRQLFQFEAKLEQAMRTHGEDIRILGLSIADRQQTASALEDKLRNTVLQLARLEGELRSKLEEAAEHERNALQSLALERDAEWAGRATELNERISAGVQSFEQSVRDIERLRFDAGAMLAQRNRDIEALTAELAQARAFSTTLLHSLSWRITRPFRFLARRFGGVWLGARGLLGSSYRVLRGRR